VHPAAGAGDEGAGTVDRATIHRGLQSVVANSGEEVSF